MDESWKLSWQRARNHEGFTRGARAFFALSFVLLFGWQAGWQAQVMPVLLGVIASALTETDDSWRGRLRAQLLALCCFGLLGLAVWATVASPWALMAVMALCAFAFTMLGSLGERYRAVAFGSLVLCIYAALAAHTSQAAAAQATPLMLAGAAWYGLVSVVWSLVMPRAPARFRLAKLYAVLGEYLRLKALLLEPVHDVDLERRRMALALHNGRVVDALNAAKESLISRVGRGASPAWLQTAMHQYLAAQDVHERVSSSHEHYDLLASAFFHSDVLYRCQRVLTVLGEQALKLSVAIEQQSEPLHWGVTGRAIKDMQAAIAHQDGAIDTGHPGAEGAAAMARPLRSLHALGNNLTALAGVFAGALGSASEHASGQAAAPSVDTTLFDREPRSLRDAWARVRAQLHAQSPWLRHSVRLSMALMAGMALMQLTQDAHGYWILLTIVFVSQPQYAATQTRLMQRAKGTAMGLVMGWAAIALFPAALVQAALLVFAGAVFFGARHTRYVLATAAVTTLLLLGFHQMGMAQGVILARLLDTAAGCLIAAAASWLVLPHWQSRQWPRLAAQVLQTQAIYLRAILAQYDSGKCDHLEYRLARRNAHNADAALSSSYSAMLKEPRHVRGNVGVVGNFLRLSHTQLNYLSALGAQRGVMGADPLDAPTQEMAGSLLVSLQQLAEKLEHVQQQADSALVSAAPAVARVLQQFAAPAAVHAPAPNTSLMAAQLALVGKVFPQLQEQARQLVELAPSPQVQV